MPELPEVETLRRGLERLLVGSTITDARIHVPKMVKGTISDPAEFTRLLRGLKIESVSRRGKHLIFALDSGYYLMFHLNMRGQLHVLPRSAPDDKYFAVGIQFDNGRELRFHDIWTWGEVRLASATELAAQANLANMGPEPLSDEWTPQDFRAALLRRPRAAIKALLLEQAVVAGIGNIYADEALFRSGIRSLRPAGSLSEEEVARLHCEIRAVLAEATSNGGTESEDYFDAEGRAGRYIPQVYGRGGKPCVRCGTTLERIKITGRGTVYCPSCQS